MEGGFESRERHNLSMDILLQKFARYLKFKLKVNIINYMAFIIIPFLSTFTAVLSTSLFCNFCSATIAATQAEGGIVSVGTGFMEKFKEKLSILEIF